LVSPVCVDSFLFCPGSGSFGSGLGFGLVGVDGLLTVNSVSAALTLGAAPLLGDVHLAATLVDASGLAGILSEGEETGFRTTSCFVGGVRVGSRILLVLKN